MLGYNARIAIENTHFIASNQIVTDNPLKFIKLCMTKSIILRNIIIIRVKFIKLVSISDL